MGRAAAIFGSVVAISLLHYSVSVHILILHEVFRRLYYVPIVVAAVLYGTQAAVGTALFASALYLPHVVVGWRDWPIVEVGQYGEIVLFFVIAAVTGVLADRLRAERNRYHDAAEALRKAYAETKARAEERLQVDRFVTMGRLAAGVAHQVRNPLGALTGCLEILEADVPPDHPKAEFFRMARNEIARLDGVVRDFLAFAEPAASARLVCRVDLRELLRTTARLAQSVLNDRHVTLDIEPCGPALVVQADDEQLKRALVSLVLETAALGRGDRVTLAARPHGGAALVSIGADVTVMPAADELFDPFGSATRGRGLALAIARRLVESQGGSVEFEPRDGAVHCVVRLPLAGPEIRASSHTQGPAAPADTHGGTAAAIGRASERAGDAAANAARDV